MKNGFTFSRLIEEYGSLEKQEDDAQAKTKTKAKEAGGETTTYALQAGTTQALMQEEERFTGAVSWSIYAEYFRYAGGSMLFPFVITLMVLAQGAQGMFAH